MQKFLLLFLLSVSLVSVSGCQGLDGLNALVETNDEAPGANCPEGGQVVHSGSDSNGNGALEPDEIGQTTYVCDGDGMNALVETADELPGPNCAEGGYLIQIGLDFNGDLELQPDELKTSSYLCHGQSARSGIVYMIPEPAGANCAAGGVKVQTGVDLNRNLTLDSGEVLQTAYVCNGKDGLNSLINQTILPPTRSCIGGTLVIESGTDLNGDGVLSSNEVTESTDSCLPCVNPRFSANPSLACPADSGPYVGKIANLNGHWMAAAESGYVYMKDSGGNFKAEDFLMIAPNGSITRPWIALPGFGVGGGIEAFGNLIYYQVTQPPGNGFKLYAYHEQGAVSATVATVGGGGIYSDMSIIDQNNIYVVSEVGVISKLNISANTLTAVANTSTSFASLHADRKHKRLYFPDGSAIKFVSALTTSAPTTVLTLPSGYRAFDIVTDPAGNLYFTCMTSFGVPCAGGAVYKATADGLSLTPVIDASKAVTRISYNAKTDQLFLVRSSNGSEPFELERVQTYRP